MEKIFASAQSHGIELEQGEYKVTRDKEGGLVRFQMTFPVKGNYPQIRKYLTALKADIPTLSLQQVQFKRQKVGDAMVEANIDTGALSYGAEIMIYPLGKLTLFGVAASAAVMSMGSNEEQVPARNGRAKMQQVAMVPTRSPEPVKLLAAGEKLEFERMLQQSQQSRGR